MAYNRKNHLKRVEEIVKIYLQEKEYDVPDTRIIQYIFPKHGIFISYRTLMNYKTMKIPSAASSGPQLQLL